MKIFFILEIYLGYFSYLSMYFQLMRNTLTASEIFTALSIVRLLQQPLVMLPQFITQVLYV